MHIAPFTSSLVTIAIPAYNRPELMRRTIDSVLQQNCNHIEILISDNCSPQQAVRDTILAYAAADKRITYFFQEKALAVIEHFDFLLQKANGKYFMWLADDDWLDSNYIDTCMQYLEQHTDYSCACGEALYYNNANEFLHEDGLRTIENNNAKKRMLQYYKNVRLNGYYYSLKRTEQAKDIWLKNEAGFDWQVVASLLYKGKLKVVDNTHTHIMAGGMSASITNMVQHYGMKKNARYFFGFYTAVNCMRDINRNRAYGLMKNRYLFSLRVFAVVYRRTFFWDLYQLKWLLYGMVGKKRKPAAG